MMGSEITTRITVVSLPMVFIIAADSPFIGIGVETPRTARPASRELPEPRLARKAPAERDDELGGLAGREDRGKLFDLDEGLTAAEIHLSVETEVGIRDRPSVERVTVELDSHSVEVGTQHLGPKSELLHRLQGGGSASLRRRG